jgi:hypothetical protein
MAGGYVPRGAGRGRIKGQKCYAISAEEEECSKREQVRKVEESRLKLWSGKWNLALGYFRVLLRDNRVIAVAQRPMHK